MAANQPLQITSDNWTKLAVIIGVIGGVWYLYSSGALATWLQGLSVTPATANAASSDNSTTATTGTQTSASASQPATLDIQLTNPTTPSTPTANATPSGNVSASPSVSTTPAQTSTPAPTTANPTQAAS